MQYDTYHGNGWALVRLSLHDPVLPINVESNVVGGSIKIVKDLYYFLKKYDFLDVSALEKAIQTWRAEKVTQVGAYFPRKD